MIRVIKTTKLGSGHGNDTGILPVGYGLKDSAAPIRRFVAVEADRYSSRNDETMLPVAASAMRNEPVTLKNRRRLGARNVVENPNLQGFATQIGLITAGIGLIIGSYMFITGG